MDKYHVGLKKSAYKDIDEVYEYIAESLQNNDAATNLIYLFEDAIFSLETMPYRGTERKIGMFANKGYRQLFVGKFIIIYRVNSVTKQVIVVKVVYVGRDI